MVRLLRPLWHSVCLRQFRKSMSSQVLPVTAKRASESNPTNHTLDQTGLFYTVPEKDRQQIFGSGGLPKSFEVNLRTFAETCLMIRKPALEIIHLLNNTDFNRPVVRYVLYGRPGCGKSLSLAHVLHYAHLNNFIIVHVPWVWNWFRNERAEVVYCSSDKELVNLPLVSAHWLKHFQLQNSEFFKTADLPISNDYVWNQRESTPAGSQLADLVTHGINRVKYAADCVSALITELKLACNGDKAKVLIAVDGFNAFFGDATNLKTEDRAKVKPSMVTLRNAFIEATKQDWKNGAIVLTVDQLSARHQTLDNEFPIYLLGRKGFEHLDPFVPIEVTEFSALEANSMLDYYEDRKWLIKSQGRSELVFLSNKNPYTLMNLCNGL